MDREALRRAAAARRSSEPPAVERLRWECSYCRKSWATERAFENHRCKERDRLHELHTLRGKQAYALYVHWMQARRLSVPVIETFAASRFYTSFVSFVDWADDVWIDPFRYVTMMVELKIDPSMWKNDGTYALYLEEYDKRVSPVKQFRESLERLDELAATHEVPLNQVFDALGLEKVLALGRQRQVSPWLLLSSKVFMDDFKGKLTTKDRLRYEATLGKHVQAFVSKVLRLKQDGLFREFRAYCEEVGL